MGTKIAIISIFILIVIVFVYFEGKKAGRDEANVACKTETIKQQEHVAKTVIKAKKIAIDNNKLECNQLIDQL